MSDSEADAPLETNTSSPRARGLFKKEAATPSAPAGESTTSSSGFERSKERLRVVLHRASGLPAMDKDGLSDPYCVLKLKGSFRSFESSCKRNTLDPVWEETFEFILPPGGREAETLHIDAFDRDWVLGVPLKPDYMGSIDIDLVGVGMGIEKQWFPLRNNDGELYQDARFLLSLSFVSFDLVEHGDAFWRMLNTDSDESHGHLSVLRRRLGGGKKEGQNVAGGGGPAPFGGAGLEEDPQQVEALRAVFPLLRPIINNLFRMMYVVVRPCMLFLLWHRRILMDWEKPGMTVLLSIINLWAWYYSLQFSLLFFYMLGWILTTYLSSQSIPTANTDEGSDEGLRSIPPQLNTAQMLEAYKQTKAELFYNELDPLAKDLESLEVLTRKVCDTVEQYRDNMFFYFDRRVVGTTLGVCFMGGVICGLFSTVVDDLLFWVVRILYLLVYVRCTLILPLSWRYPSLFPTVLMFILRPFRGPIRAVQVWLRRRTQLREITRAEDVLDAQRNLATSRSATKAMWESLQKDVGRKLKLRKGQLLEEPGAVSHFVYFLVKGKVESRAPGSPSSSVGTMLSAPCSLFVANVLIGHGVITHSVTAVVNCKLCAFDVSDLRHYFEKRAAVAEKFFLDLAVELATELKIAVTKSVHDLEEADAKGKAEDIPDPMVKMSTVYGTIAAGTSAVASASEPEPVPIQPYGIPPTSDVPTPPRTHALTQTQDLFSMRALEDDAPDKLWRFFQDTFRVTVKREKLKVFDKGLWTKKGWSRFPGRVFLTPNYIAFWSQVGKKSLLGGTSKGAGVESWIVPLQAIQAFSLHAREGHVKLTIDAQNQELQGLEQQSVVLEPSKLSKKKSPSVKIHSDDQTQLTELRRSIELALSVRDVKEAVGDGVAGKLSILSTLVGIDSTPVLGGVELTVGTMHLPDLQKVQSC
jgi:CRP-like cAMP-binding protein